MKENKTVSEGFSDTILDSVQRKGLTEKLYLSSAKTMLRAKKRTLQVVGTSTKALGQ